MGSRIGTAVLGIFVITSLIANKFGARRPSVRQVVLACFAHSAYFGFLFYWALAYQIEAELYLAVGSVILTPVLFALVFSVSAKKANRNDIPIQTATINRSFD